MKIPDFHKLLFRLNVTVTGLVFFLLVPTTHIYVSWCPDKESTLWLIPVAVIAGSAILWFFMSLSLPVLVKYGVLEDRRKIERSGGFTGVEKFFRITFPIFVLVAHMMLLIFFCGSVIVLMNSGAAEKIWVNLP